MHRRYYNIILDLVKTFNKHGLSTEMTLNLCEVAVKLYDVNETLYMFELGEDEDLIEHINTLDRDDFLEWYKVK